MLRKHRLSPYIAVLIITIVGASITLILVQAIHAAEAPMPVDRVAELEARLRAN